MDVSQMLEQTLSPDEHTRVAASRFLEEAMASDFPQYMLTLCAQLADESKSKECRQAAGLGLKNCLTSKDDGTRTQLQQRWLAVDANARAQIKQGLLQTLRSPVETAASPAAQGVSAIAAAELPVGQWTDLIQGLLDNVASAGSAELLKVATLKCIGYICEEINPTVLVAQANGILTAVVQGMRKQEPSFRVRLAATQALINSLEFVNENFKNEHERNFIMQVVCEATRCEDQKVVVAAFQALVKIMSLYYEYMEQYMVVALFPLTLEAMRSEVEDIALQGIEFWSTVCDAELELAIELSEAVQLNHQPEAHSKFYAKGALPHISPIVLGLLAKQDDDDDDDTWNVSMAAGVCLALIANCVGADVIPYAVPFITEHIKSNDWHFREAALMAFGSILEGPGKESLVQLVNEALPFVVGLMKDSSTQTKDTAAWCVGRICDLLPECVLKEDVLPQVLHTLADGLADEPRVAANAAWALNTLSESAYDCAPLQPDRDEPHTYMLSSAYEVLTMKLLETTERADGAESNLRAAAYESWMQLISTAPRDCYPVVQKDLVLVMQRLDQCLNHENQIVGTDDRLQYNEWQSLLCATLQTVIRKLEREDIVANADTIMRLLLRMFASTAGKSGNVYEDALMAVTALVNALEGLFAHYMDAFKQYLLLTLRNHAEYQACAIAVGVVGDICRALGAAALPYCDDFMQALLENLASDNLNRSVKPPILSAFGDIAMAIGSDFKKYLDVVLRVLQQASVTSVDKDDYDMVDFLNALREGCLEAYSGIIHALKGDAATPSPDVQLLHGHVEHIMNFIEHISGDPDHTDGVLRAALGVLGDLCEAYKGALQPLLHKPFVDNVIQQGRRSKAHSTKQLANWCNKSVKAIRG